MRSLPLALFLMLGLTKTVPDTGHGMVRFTPVELDRDHPERRDYGALELTGIWKLTSDLSAFGGISAIHVAQGQVLALADTAETLSFPFDGQQAEARVNARPLPGIYTPGNDSPDHDSESLTFDPKRGTAWVGFETSNAIRRFSPGLRDKKGWAIPAAMAHWPENIGPEAMTRLSDGRFLIFSEAAKGPDEGAFEALLLHGDPTRNPKRVIRFFYRPPEGYRPTDAVELPDGRVMLLNRHFSVLDGVAATLTLIDPARIAAGRVVEGREIARLAPPLNVDNMEGLSIEPTEKRGRIIVWLASDDNFNPLQQTLLMRFALDLQRVR